MTPRRFRELTASRMQCQHCQSGRLLITPSGMLVCENGCGKLLPLEHLIIGSQFIFTDLQRLKRAYPDRLIEPSPDRKEADRAIRQEKRQKRFAATG